MSGVEPTLVSNWDDFFSLSVIYEVGASIIPFMHEQFMVLSLFSNV